MQLSMFAVALFPQTISAADPAAGDACAPYTVLADVGLMDEPTTLHHYTNTTAAAQCCSLCAADSRCVAWTYHAAPVHDCYTYAIAHCIEVGRPGRLSLQSVERGCSL